jgi:hypothetical protein
MPYGATADWTEGINVTNVTYSISVIPLIGLQPLILTVYSKKKLNSVAVVRKRTIPTELPPLVGEVSAKFCGQKVLRGQRNEFPRPLISVF